MKKQENESAMYIKSIIISLILLLLIDCKEMNNNENTYPYEVSATASVQYPMEVHMGYLLNEKKEFICGVPKTGALEAGWQGDASTGGQGGIEIPAYLYLTYVSYAEKKFYTVEGELPSEKILETLKKGYERYDSGLDGTLQETYKTITIGMAPGGVIVVWLSGIRNRKEIARLQAKETFVDVNEFFNNPFELNQQQFFDSWYDIAVSDSIRQEIKEKGIPYGLWDRYRDKYKYRFVLNPYNGKDYFTYIYSVGYNGETEETLEIENSKTEYKEKGIPYKNSFIFKDYSTEIIFNDIEMLEVFKQFKDKYPHSPMDIVITPTFMYNDMKISVKCEKEEIPLKKYKVVGVWGGE